LKGQISYEKEGNLYCETHYHEKFSPPCAYCKVHIKKVN
jgi:hypothetical protein